MLVLFRFPFRNEKLCQKWVNALKRKNFTPTRASLVCSDHFREEDYVSKIGLKKRRLKPNAVPSIFDFPVFNQLPENSEQQSAVLPKPVSKTRKLKRKKKKKTPKTQNTTRVKSTNSAFIESVSDRINKELELNICRLKKRY